MRRMIVSLSLPFLSKARTETFKLDPRLSFSVKAQVSGPVVAVAPVPVVAPGINMALRHFLLP